MFEYDIDKVEVFEAMLQDGYLLIEFYAGWCGTCRSVTRMLQHLDTKNVINIARIDIDRHPHLVDQYQVLGVPLIVLTYRRAEIKRFGGSINYQEFKEWISTVEAFKELS